MFSSERGVRTQYLFVVSLGQAVIYLAIWLWNEYVASYITLIFPAMIFIILVLARIADWIEPSRIPGWYYTVMMISIIIPIIIGAIFYYINNGQIGWLIE